MSPGAIFPTFHHSGETSQTVRLRAGWLAVAAAVVTISLKFVAWWLTGSAGLLSDAVESLANLATAVAVLLSLWYASRPVDRSHNYGHDKVEFFASGIEGIVIIGAAIGIGWIGVARLLDPHQLESLGLGTAIALVATGVNLVVGRYLIRVGRTHRSPALSADGRHIMTDVLTTGGVLAGLALVVVTGWLWLDAVIAIAIALNVAWTGWRLIRVGFDGLMDRALPVEDELRVRRAIEGVLRSTETTYHALRTREAGSRRFVDFHLLVPARTSVANAHSLATTLEHAIDATLPGVETTVHIEPLEDAASWSDSAVLPFEQRADDRTPAGAR